MWLEIRGKGRNRSLTEYNSALGKLVSAVQVYISDGNPASSAPGLQSSRLWVSTGSSPKLPGYHTISNNTLYIQKINVSLDNAEDSFLPT